MKLLDYIKTKEFKNSQKSRGWKNRRENGSERRPTKHIWDGERNHFGKQIEEEDWGKHGGLKKQESNRTLRRKIKPME